MNIKVWLSAFRLRTLPLALSSIFMGSFLAAAHGRFELSIFILAVLTTIFLQILSNLANDYGDSVHGADHSERLGPKRAVQTGKISPQAMKKAIYIFIGLALLSGLSLIWTAFKDNLSLFFIFLGLGIAAIIAAITYTAGKKPYGYAGLGDISVLIFFGWVGVIGTYFLYTHHFGVWILLPATSCGLFAVGVLNINNIRDITSDKKAGKLSIPVRLGREKAVYYHWALLSVGFSCAIIFTALNYYSNYQWLFLITAPLFLINARAVKLYEEPARLDPYLKQMALSTLQFVIMFGVGLLL
ncbi:1,4-dihydroxy-2-naphthoate polyprenyltransferase [Thermoflexibacter ruber]|uniref:1,4-dihydroxy-2-naphthoate octaprenyltransferase n=1 Tax=Thermoflexibacter ruber TaxID=1003 RepID=A0A1I2H0V7_9BACT|nr:1,4-dihydroxy-2-naphthoate polyprenyltransferase [Thermoflexibacter ruber]SFF23040.1 1,4-dihydroxy-2-naphthoate prenyltransferase [Thermoflexibacter ruber]